MFVAEQDFKRLRIGDRVKSFRGNTGKITRLVSKENTEDKRENEITIVWDETGLSSSNYQSYFNRVVHIKGH